MADVLILGKNRVVIPLAHSSAARNGEAVIRFEPNAVEILIFDSRVLLYSGTISYDEWAQITEVATGRLP